MNERRHRINRSEIPAVSAGLHLCLKLYLSGGNVPFNVGPALRAYYRITHYQPHGGRPDYPDNTKEDIMKLLEENESTFEILKKIGTFFEMDPFTPTRSVPSQLTSDHNLKKPDFLPIEEIQEQ